MAVAVASRAPVFTFSSQLTLPERAQHTTHTNAHTREELAYGARKWLHACMNALDAQTRTHNAYVTNNIRCCLVVCIYENLLRDDDDDDDYSMLLWGLSECVCVA